MRARPPQPRGTRWDKAVGMSLMMRGRFFVPLCFHGDVTAKDGMIILKKYAQGLGGPSTRQMAQDVVSLLGSQSRTQTLFPQTHPHDNVLL